MSADVNSLESLDAYRSAYQIGNDVWRLVKCWHHFDQKTIGVQMVRAADSISANIAEGYGRFHYREKLRFFYFARGSLYECKDWTRKARDRDLIEKHVAEELISEMSKLNKILHGYIRRTRNAIR